MTDHQPAEAQEPSADQRKLAQMQRETTKSIEQLAAGGINPAAVTPVLTAVRLEALLEAILSPEDRLSFELLAETRMQAALEQMKNQIARARLTQGIVPVKANGSGKRS